MNMIKLDLVLLCQLGGQTGEKTYAHETRRYTLSFLMHLQSLHAYDTKLGLCSFFLSKRFIHFIQISFHFLQLEFQGQTVNLFLESRKL